VVARIQEKYGLSERAACRLVSQPRGTQRWIPTVRADADALTRAIVSLEEIKTLVGKELSVSDWVVIDQPRIAMFADATEDHSSVRVDPKIGMEWKLGGTIAHSFLTLSMILHLQDGLLPMPANLTRGITTGSNTCSLRRRCGAVGATGEGLNWISSRSKSRAKADLDRLKQEIENAALTALSQALGSTAWLGEWVAW